MRIIFPLLLSIITATLYFAFQQSSSQGVLNYKSNFIGLQIDFPESWVYADSKEIPYVSFIPSNEAKFDRLPNLQDVFLSVSKDPTVKYKNVPLEYTKSQIPLNSSYAEVGEPKRMMLNNGSAGYGMILKSYVGKKQILLISVVYEGIAYRVIYKAPISKYEQCLPTILGMISSIKFI
jgi:hypothetical protein